MISLRFYVKSIERHAGNEHVTVKLAPSYKDGRNADWAKWTPSGSIELTVGNPAAIKQFDEWLNHPNVPVDLHIVMQAVTDD